MSSILELLGTVETPCGSCVDIEKLLKDEEGDNYYWKDDLFRRILIARINDHIVLGELKVYRLCVKATDKQLWQAIGDKGIIHPVHLMAGTVLSEKFEPCHDYYRSNITFVRGGSNEVVSAHSYWENEWNFECRPYQEEDQRLWRVNDKVFTY